MLWRIAARLVTGPLAFLVAGVIDVGLFGAAVLRHQVRLRVRTHLRGRPGEPGGS